MKATRGEVYAATDGERDYQESQKGNAKRHEGQPSMTPGEMLYCMEEVLKQARAAWYKPDGGDSCLPFVRKIAGLAVQCMELHGAPQREGFERIPLDIVVMRGDASVRGRTRISEPVANGDLATPGEARRSPQGSTPERPTGRLRFGSDGRLESEVGRFDGDLTFHTRWEAVPTVKSAAMSVLEGLSA